MSMVTVSEIVLGYLLRTAHALCHILPRHFDVNAAGVSAQRRMHLEESSDLFENPIECTGLVTG